MVKHLTFRILVDNTDDNNILFSNARAMGCDLTWGDYLVLTHGHYGHPGNIS
ncbi:hypothetical protein [Photobacterium sp. J15]|uniref:hypothetical protein n=1 Tax=Photobacterium sp. J15 TaxID=265901 RepID=UPI000A446C42|nr:hypothetical protein [Photobacterium sp. J15]